MGPKKTRSIIHPVSCTLEELYNGKTTRVKVSRQRLKNKDASQSNDKDKKPELEKQQKVLELSIDKGSPDGEKFIFHGEADEHPDRESGDVVFVVQR